MLVRLGDALASVPVEVVPTSFAALDGALGIGGIPCGRLAKLPQNLVVLIEGVLKRQDRVTNLMARRIMSLHQEALVAGSCTKRPHRR